MAPTTSPEPCDPEATPKAAESKRRPNSKPRSDKKIRWDKLKVFERPVFRLPYTLSKYVPSPGRHGGSVEPQLWVQAAIESGLVEMAPRDEVARKGEWFEPIGDHPPEGVNRVDLERDIILGLEKTLNHMKGNK